MSLYQPPQFRSAHAQDAADIIRGWPFASLISTDDEGLPFVTHLPLHLEVEEGGHFRLWGHVAKPNPQWKHLEARPRALVTFMGPHAYQSPAIYPDKQRVPSWNYLAVHCQVQARLITEPQPKDVMLKMLIADHEAPYAQQWQDLGHDYQTRMMAGIVGLELSVTQWSCKLKLNQHRPESHARLHEVYAGGGDDARALAQWMERLGLRGPGEA